MTELELKLIAGGAMALVLALGTLLLWLQQGRFRRHPPVSDDRCAACDAADLDRPAPGVYRCRACGYEGGSARAQLEASKRTAAWERRPSAERFAAAARDLTEARRVLSAVEREVGNVIGVGASAAFETFLETADVDFDGDEGLRTRQRNRMKVVGTLLEAHNLLRAAAEKVPELVAPPLPVDPTDAGPRELRALREVLLTAVSERAARLDALRGQLSRGR